MRRSLRLFALVLCLAVAFAPALAEARAGGGFSMGSRGGRTYSAPPSTGTSPYGAAPMQRSTTVPGSSYGSTGYGGGLGGFGRSGLGAGFMGGLLGFGLGSALFGHGGGYGYGGGYGGYGGMGILGLLLRLAIVFFIVRWLFRRFAGQGRGLGGLGSGLGAMFTPRTAAVPMGYGAPMSAPLAGPPVAIQPADYGAFEVLLKNVQAAWSNGDLNAMRNYASPEMVSYFAEQLADNASRGRRNVVSDVRLQKGDLSEAWSEDGRSFATVAMNYSMSDVTYDPSGRVVEGSPSEHVSATEYWTFMRAAGGRWMLSAIQQALPARVG